MNEQDYVVVPSNGEGVKDALKKHSSEGLLKGYNRFLMPRGIVPHTFEDALEVMKGHKSPEKKARPGSAYVVLLNTGDYFFYVDYKTSMPVSPIRKYGLLFDLEGADFYIEVTTNTEDVEEIALAEMFKIKGDPAREAELLEMVELAVPPMSEQ